MAFGDDEGDDFRIERYREHPTLSMIDLICEETEYRFGHVKQRLSRLGHLERNVRHNISSLEGNRLSEYPSVAVEFVPDEEFQNPEDIIISRNRTGPPRNWECIRGHVWPERTWTRLRRGISCPICKSIRQDAGFVRGRDDSRSESRPREGYLFANDRNGDLELSHLSARSENGAWWRCFEADDHYWFAPASNVIGLQSGCSCCYGKTVVPSNSFVTIYPAIAADVVPTEDYPLTPEQVTSKCDIELWFVCENCREGSPARVSNRTILGEGCRFCRGVYASPSNCLAVNRPDLAAEWHPTRNIDISPFDVRAGSEYPAWWLCSDPDCGMEWQAACYSRSSMGRGCPYCGGQVPRPGESFGDIRTTLMEEWDYDRNSHDPFSLTPSSSRDAHWVCRRNQEHRWEAAISNRVAGRSNCPACTISGISIIQNLIAFEIGTFFPVDHNLRQIRFEYEGESLTIRPDIVLRDHRVIIEFDGNYWHSGNEDRDIRESLKRVQAGYRVLRIRESPLGAIEMDGVTSVIVPDRVDAKTATNAALGELRQGQFNLHAPDISEYLLQDELASQEQADAYWEELLRIHGRIG